jgi:hypothetical protein
VLLAWLIALLVAVSVVGFWIASRADDSRPTPVMHIGPPAAEGVATNRTTFRDLTGPDHPRVWTLELSHRTRAVDVAPIVERR